MNEQHEQVGVVLVGKLVPGLTGDHSRYAGANLCDGIIIFAVWYLGFVDAFEAY